MITKRLEATAKVTKVTPIMDKKTGRYVNSIDISILGDDGPDDTALIRFYGRDGVDMAKDVRAGDLVVIKGTFKLVAWNGKEFWACNGDAVDVVGLADAEPKPGEPLKTPDGGDDIPF